MKPNVLRWLTLTALALSASSVFAQVEQLIDLASADHVHKLGTVPTASRMTDPPAIALSHRVTAAPAMPFAMTLVTFDATSYRVRDQFAYEVRLQNISSQSIDMPAAVDESQFSKDLAGNRSISIRLEATSQDQVDPAAYDIAYGGSLVSGSLVTVPPGGTIRYRGSGYWDGQRLSLGWSARDVSVRALLRIWIVGQEVPNPIASGNTISVHVVEQ